MLALISKFSKELFLFLMCTRERERATYVDIDFVYFRSEGSFMLLCILIYDCKCSTLWVFGRVSFLLVLRAV